MNAGRSEGAIGQVVHDRDCAFGGVDRRKERANDAGRVGKVGRGRRVAGAASA